MPVCAAFIPVRRLVLVGVDTGHAYALENIVPCAASLAMFGVLNLKLLG